MIPQTTQMPSEKVPEVQVELCFDAEKSNDENKAPNSLQLNDQNYAEKSDSGVETQKQKDDAAKLSERKATRKALMPFAIISISYLLYTITDGSVRMIVLLHAYNKSFTAMEV